AVGVSEFLVRFAVERFALFHGFPKGGVAHNDGVNDAELVEGELILAEDADALGARDIPTGGFLFASEDPHEGRFARAVRAGNGVAAAGHEGAGDVLKEDARAEAHGDVFYREHILSSLADRMGSKGIRAATDVKGRRPSAIRKRAGVTDRL